MRTKKPLTRRESRDALRMWSAFAADRDKAADSDTALGLDKPERTRAKPVPWEELEQQKVVHWAHKNEDKWPELRLLHAIPNAGKRDQAVGAKLKSQGMKAGVPDLHLPIARGKFHGLWIELKTPAGLVNEDGRVSKGGRVSEVQADWIRDLRAAGSRVEVCVGWEAARAVIEEYLA